MHRDYAAHFFRWGWVARQIKQGQSVLDIGCGQDQPLLYILGSRMQTVPDVYVGVDLNSIPKKSHVRWADVLDNYDFVTNGKKLEKYYTPFDVAVCLEVIEHMGTEDGAKLLENISYLLAPGGILYLSTPVFDGQAAANHIHEYTIPELAAAIAGAGFEVKRRIGTFASKPAIRQAAYEARDTAALEVYDRLEQWFGGDVMSTFLAPLYPDASRNNLWVCHNRRPERADDKPEERSSEVVDGTGETEKIPEGQETATPQVSEASEEIDTFANMYLGSLDVNNPQEG